MINATDRSQSPGVPTVQSSMSAGQQQTQETNAGTSGAAATTPSNEDHERRDRPIAVFSTTKSAHKGAAQRGEWDA
jgi:hypothetical protein